MYVVVETDFSKEGDGQFTKLDSSGTCVFTFSQNHVQLFYCFVCMVDATKKDITFPDHIFVSCSIKKQAREPIQTISTSCICFHSCARQLITATIF